MTDAQREMNTASVNNRRTQAVVHPFTRCGLMVTEDDERRVRVPAEHEYWNWN